MSTKLFFGLFVFSTLTSFGNISFQLRIYLAYAMRFSWNHLIITMCQVQCFTYFIFLKAFDNSVVVFLQFRTKALNQTLIEPGFFLPSPSHCIVQALIHYALEPCLQSLFQQMFLSTCLQSYTPSRPSGKADTSQTCGHKHNNCPYKLKIRGREKYEINLSLFQTSINFNSEKIMN